MFYSALLKGRQGGWLWPNDCRSETGFAAVAGGDDGRPAGEAGDDEPKLTRHRRATSMVTSQATVASLASISTGPAMATNQSRNSGLDPGAPEFASVRADLGRLYIRHKADLSMADRPDDEIVARVNDITATLIILAKMARASDVWDWLLRRRWFFAACGRLFEDGDAVPLDG